MNQETLGLLRQALMELLGSGYRDIQLRPSGTGCINDSWEAYGSGVQSLFVKTGPASAQAMYACEATGLDVLRQCDAIRVPLVIGQFQFGPQAALVLEFITLHSIRSSADQAVAEALATLHSVHGTHYGFIEDNFIGRTPQINCQCDDWWQFWCESRMHPQWRLARLRGMRKELLDRIEQLIVKIPSVFGAHQPESVLLHGDLWSGNMALDQSGKLCLYDPAVYYGDRETDLAMTRMFGALPAPVYEFYHRIHPLSPDAARRQVLYDLYHWLNHFNLFGVTYLGQVENSVDHLLNLMD